MNRKLYRVLALAPALVGLMCVPAAAQKKRPSAQRQKAVAAAPARAAIFAVLNDGGTLEPIALIGKGKLVEPVNGSDDETRITAFDRTYYKTGTSYRLIFGGANAGSVKVKAFDPKAECSRNMADVTTTSTSAKLKGLVMGLATNSPKGASDKGFRERPTAAEKSEIDALARSEFKKQKLTAKDLHYQNLTAVDVDHDGKPEFVGSYWIEIDKLTRGLLFLIAQKTKAGKYAVGYKDYQTVDQSRVMGGGQISDVDEGVYHELLLDVLDYDGDGVAEIFTYTQGFEGAGFNVFRRTGSKWIRTYQFNNYHCAF